MKKEDIYYRAMLARDHRFDGKFFIGVKTTGIYCRPICPAKPKRENVEFFSNYLEAEKSGYRPCMRCRPESAPMSPAWIGKSAVVQRAIKVLHGQETIDFDENKFADLFGVTARHLRRLFNDEIGKTPKQLSFENRLNLSRKLITETALPLTEVAFASGFNSIRRFNDAFKKRFKKNPTEIRRNKVDINSNIVVSLPYRPPFNYLGLMHIYEMHKVGKLERFVDNKMFRTIHFNGKTGQIIISNDEENSQLLVEINFPDTSMIHAIISRVRHLFDLDSDPIAIANSLEKDSAVKKILKKHPGIRLPSGWDPFEVGIATILGQLVSVEMGKSLVADLIEIAGKETKTLIDGEIVKLFPGPKEIIKADLTKLKTTNARKQTLINFSQALVDNELSLEPTQDVDVFIKKAMAIKGIGRWTADYMALKVLRNTDSFPSTDLILARTLIHHPEDIIQQMSPWRGYVAALFWREYSATLTKKKVK
ncbi:MAG: DNA-3-methyladenine glycosylase 2 family protein [Rhizobacter sp.]|nr:DNA-3-methyladenine glycosylase 2 family protein [Bacteriovorax sp.]